MRRWRGDLRRLSLLLQGGSSVWSHLMKINLILSLSHLPRVETSAALSDNCSCLKLSSLCHTLLTCFCALCKPESRRKLSPDQPSQASQAIFTQYCHQEKETVFPLCFLSVITWRRCETDVPSHRLAIFNETLVIYTVLTYWNKHLPAGQSTDPADQHFVGGKLTTLEQLTADTLLGRQL